MASSSFTRCPSDATPSSFRFSCVKLGRTVSSMSFSRNAASYFPRPRLRSQTTMSMTAPTIGGGAHHLTSQRRCPGQIGLWVLRGLQRPLRSYRQWQCLSMIVKIPERPRNPDFPASEGPIFISLRACGSFQRIADKSSTPAPLLIPLFNRFNSAPRKKERRCTVIKLRLSGYVARVATG